MKFFKNLLINTQKNIIWKKHLLIKFEEAKQVELKVLSLEKDFEQITFKVDSQSEDNHQLLMVTRVAGHDHTELLANFFRKQEALDALKKIERALFSKWWVWYQRVGAVVFTLVLLQLLIPFGGQAGLPKNINNNKVSQVPTLTPEQLSALRNKSLNLPQPTDKRLAPQAFVPNQANQAQELDQTNMMLEQMKKNSNFSNEEAQQALDMFKSGK